MSVPIESRIVTSPEARRLLTVVSGTLIIEGVTYVDLVNTVATEPDRTRAAVVKALREAEFLTHSQTRGLANAIENGADW